MMKKAGIAALGAVFLALTGWLGVRIFTEGKNNLSAFRLASVEKRDMVNRISASGELSAVVTVAVGSEISGQIKELLADFNSKVKNGEIIARLDPQSYEVLVRQAEAELTLANAKRVTQEATVARYQADLENADSLYAAAKAQTAKARAVLESAQRDFQRKEALVKQDFISRNDFDAAQTALAEASAQLEQAQAQENAAGSKVVSSKAGLSMAKAQIQEALAQIQLKSAELEKRRVDLERTVIRSPVDGVVIDRSVDIGQTVAASLQAPTLFTIAQDLGQMQVSASVDEADIGLIRENQPAKFTVDAFAGKKFQGRVAQIRKAGKTVQNVVTYTVILAVNNPELILMPGMTAEVEIEVARREQVLTVPNAALRFKPSAGEAGETAAAAPPDPSFAETPGSSGGRGEAQERLRRLTQDLALSPEQQDALRDAFKKAMEKIRSSREAGGFNPGAVRDQVRRETLSVLLRVLTPEQKVRYEALSEGKNRGTQKGTLWRPDPAGRAVPVSVEIGISDGTHTEVSGAGIAPGMPVILGTR